MKIKLLTLILFFSIVAKAQIISKDDISFKAKLLTVSPLGLASSETIMRDVNNQEVKFLTPDSGRIVIMKIEFNQHYFQGEKTSTEIVGGCSFFVGYNKELYKFYRLNGFDSSDAAAFFSELKANEFIALTSDKNIMMEIDLICLAKAARRSKQTRKRSACEMNCSSVLSTQLTVH